MSEPSKSDNPVSESAQPPRRFVRFHHLGVAVPDLPKAVEWYRHCLGHQVLSGPFDNPIQRVSVCFVGDGERDSLPLELVAPLGPNSPVDNVLAKNLGAYHACYEVDDIEKALAWFCQQGCLVVSKPVSAVAFDNRRIAWVFTPTRQLLELVESP